jgi:hypothetical protein
MTLTTRIAALALAFTSALSLTLADPASACGGYSRGRITHAKFEPREHVKGTVIAFRGLPAIRADGAAWRVVIQYPTFQSSGQMLYQTDVRVPAAQLRPLQRALEAALAKDETARAGVELEQVGADEWRLVAWSI